jgi:hypothetical protein
MRRLCLLSTALILAFGLSGGALADPNENSETTGKPGNGNQFCQNGSGASVHREAKNFGQYFRLLNEEFGFMTPEEWADGPTGGDESVREWMERVCTSEVPRPSSKK